MEAPDASVDVRCDFVVSVARMGEKVQVGEVSMYYDTFGGNGHPMVLLHGALGGGYMLGDAALRLAANHHVFVPDMRGRAHTPDVPGELSYMAMARDVIGFIDHEIDEPVDLVGASDGGIIGLAIAMTSPSSLRTLVTIGGNYHFDGVASEAGVFDTPHDDESVASLRDAYGEMSPDGLDHWPVIYAKVMEMASTQPTWTSADLESIETPTLVICGDDDLISLEHTISLYRAIPESRLAVIPGASHACFLERPELVLRIIEDFVDDPSTPETMVPIRRAPNT